MLVLAAFLKNVFEKVDMTSAVAPHRCSASLQRALREHSCPAATLEDRDASVPVN